MVTSIEIPTSIAIPITTAVSTESLCDKFMFSYVKTFAEGASDWGMLPNRETINKIYMFTP
jgi:hypothetical protein